MNSLVLGTTRAKVRPLGYSATEVEGIIDVDIRVQFSVVVTKLQLSLVFHAEKEQ